MALESSTNEPVLLAREMRIDDIDSGLPLLTVDMTTCGGPAFAIRLAPDAVRALVDGLAGVAEPNPGECRIIAKLDVTTLADVLLRLPGKDPRQVAEDAIAKATEAVLRADLDLCNPVVAQKLPPERGV